MVRLHVKMMRFRRYRVFLAIAAIGTILLIRLSQNQEWDPIPEIFDSSRYDDSDTSLDFDPHTGTALKAPVPEPSAVDVEGLAHKETLDDSKLPPPKEDLPPKKELLPEDDLPSKAALPPKEDQPATKTTDTPPTIPKQVLPDRLPALASMPLEDEEVETQIHMESAGRVEPIVDATLTETIHWEKQKEHFPVEKIIQLPTGTPLKIPTIQFQFSGESADAKLKREERLAKVKKEFVRAWGGYKEFAWMDDELMPVSGSHRNPFGGWSATLVDSLDTLWIMGLNSDFEEAVQAVGTIDFTTSKRADIQMFETTIRYLGGLLGAYDISGGKYKTLLDKAVELAEVLIGAFDTPNRMPDLYYRWKPAFASQRHRASVRSNLAELGSMSLEFTRLAQLTKDAKYYDAVARVTDALEEWQNRGTTVPGVFPEAVDASGCNRTVPNLPNELLDESEPEGYTPPQPKTGKEPKKTGKTTVGEQLEIKITPGEPGRAQILVVDDTQTPAKRDLGDTGTGNVSMNAAPDSINSPRGGGEPTPSPTLPVGTPSQEEWDCVAQGLDASGSGVQAFGMGGSQDSTYEYLPKQYLLLGGLETKYKTMYTKSLEAVYKYMLYRPMIPDERDILFSGKLTAREMVTEDGVEIDIHLDAEVTHLSCFIGGMVGMGAKLFGSDTDLEIAKKLTEGCVWAYESMASGIMAEYAKVVPCESPRECPWNATLWEEYLDPISSQRDQLVRDYDDRNENMRIQKEAALTAYEEKLALSDDNGSIKDDDAEALAYEEAMSNQAAEHTAPKTIADVERNAPPSSRSNDVAQNKNGSSPALGKRVPVDRKPTQKGATNLTAQQDARDKLLKEKLAATEEELTIAAAGHENYPPTTGADQIIVPGQLAHDPRRPLTHKELIEQGITEGTMVQGYVSIPSNNYILRPEAIESVWYMYRITGDPLWQEKGWKMFESIIAATSTPHGHSAIDFVTSVTPSQQDKMESFWLAETLKYFYLLFSTPDVVSLDEWVLNTEAHPFKRPS